MHTGKNRTRCALDNQWHNVAHEVRMQTCWEQGKRSPTGAAKALLKVLDKAPEAALAALS